MSGGKGGVLGEKENPHGSLKLLQQSCRVEMVRIKKKENGRRKKERNEEQKGKGVDEVGF